MGTRFLTCAIQSRRPRVPPNAAITGLLVVASVTYGPVLAKLVSDWWSIGDYSHGLICAPMAIAIGWGRRAELQEAPQAPHSVGYLGVVGAVLLLLLGTLGAELFLTRISFLLFLASAVVFIAGWRHLRILLFPLALLLVAVPIPAIVLTRVTLPLQFAASTTAEMALNAVNIPVLREGNVLVLPNATLQVAEACSGIRSLMALMTIGLVIARFAESRWLARIAILLAAVPVAVLVNALRVAVTAAATYAFGPVALVGVVHEALGGVMFLLALVLIAASARGIAQCRRTFTPEPVV
jgi:exosortase